LPTLWHYYKKQTPRLIFSALGTIKSTLLWFKRLKTCKFLRLLPFALQANFNLMVCPPRNPT